MGGTTSSRTPGEKIGEENTKCIPFEINGKDITIASPMKGTTYIALNSASQNPFAYSKNILVYQTIYNRFAIAKLDEKAFQSILKNWESRKEPKSPVLEKNVRNYPMKSPGPISHLYLNGNATRLVVFQESTSSTPRVWTICKLKDDLDISPLYEATTRSPGGHYEDGLLVYKDGTECKVVRDSDGKVKETFDLDKRFFRCTDVKHGNGFLIFRTDEGSFIHSLTKSPPELLDEKFQRQPLFFPSSSTELTCYSTSSRIYTAQDCEGFPLHFELEDSRVQFVDVYDDYRVITCQRRTNKLDYICENRLLVYKGNQLIHSRYLKSPNLYPPKFIPREGTPTPMLFFFDQDRLYLLARLDENSEDTPSMHEYADGSRSYRTYTPKRPTIFQMMCDNLKASPVLCAAQTGKLDYSIPSPPTTAPVSGKVSIIEERKIFQFQCLGKQWCRSFVEELTTLKSYFPGITANPDGFSLEPFKLHVGVKNIGAYFFPIIRSLYSLPSDLVLCLTNSIVVRYCTDKKEDRHMEHVDDSDWTLNICVGEVFEDSQLCFGDKRVTHAVGHAVLHPGNVVHSTTPITSGVRWNLVLWFNACWKFPFQKLLPEIKTKIVEKLDLRWRAVYSQTCKEAKALAFNVPFWQSAILSRWPDTKEDVKAKTNERQLRSLYCDLLRSAESPKDNTLIYKKTVAKIEPKQVGGQFVTPTFV